MIKISVRDNAAKAEETGSADFFGTASTAAISACMNLGRQMYGSLVNLGGTAGKVQQKSAEMAGTLKSNPQNLQTAFLSFAGKNLTGPLEKPAGLLNKPAENPEKAEDTIRNIA